MAVKNYGVSVREKLKNYQTDKVTYQQALIRYLHERLLYRLSVQNLSMDIGFGDIVIPHPVELDYPALLEGMDDIPVMAYSLETVVAEKFQTMIARTVLNSRMKDFYDVYTIFNHNDLDEDNLKLAVTEVMANRDTHYEENHPLFTEEVGKDLSRNTQWAAFIKKNKIDDAPSFPEVLSFICDRMKPVWESLA